jgi:hypothetical protein
LPRSTTPPASRQGASPNAEHRHTTGQRGKSRRDRGLAIADAQDDEISAP